MIFPHAAVGHTNLRKNDKQFQRMVFAETSHPDWLYGHAFEVRRFVSHIAVLLGSHDSSVQRAFCYSILLAILYIFFFFERCQSLVCYLVIRRLSW